MDCTVRLAMLEPVVIVLMSRALITRDMAILALGRLPVTSLGSEQPRYLILIIPALSLVFGATETWRFDTKTGTEPSIDLVGVGSEDFDNNSIDPLSTSLAYSYSPTLALCRGV